MNKYLIGCIGNCLRSMKAIKTRFFLIDNNNIEDVTLKLCKGVEHIAPFRYKYGLANYNFGCGLSHYLDTYNLNTVNGLDLNNTHLIMLTLNDLKNIVGCKTVFDIDVEEKLLNYIKSYYR
ncbi:TPA: hypothetical protein PC562_000316 [Clostridioides difficile]|nr:hypothetical protein [Clostridioides difficile]